MKKEEVYLTRFLHSFALHIAQFSESTEGRKGVFEDSKWILFWRN